VGRHALGLRVATPSLVDRTVDLHWIPGLDVIHNVMHRLWITLYRGFRDSIPLKVADILRLS
jgi:hypothetical protein